MVSFSSIKNDTLVICYWLFQKLLPFIVACKLQETLCRKDEECDDRSSEKGL